jgi:multiple sugar transport system substrate-binding protein
MSRRWKRIALLTVTAALALVVAAFASAKPGKISGPASSKATNLSIMGFGTNGDDVAMTRFHRAEAAVGGNVDAPNGGFDDQQFLAALASGNVPDLVYLDRAKVGTYAAKGAFVPLTSCISSHHIIMSQYRKPAVQEVTYKGKVYGIPEFYTARTIIGDLDVMKAAHVSVKDLNTKNLARLKVVAKKMYQESGGKVTRIGFDPKLPEFFPLWAKAFGVDILSKDGLHAHLNDPRAVAALSYAVSLINEQGGWNKFKSFRDTWDFFGAGNQVAKNQIGAWPMEQWYYNVLAGTSPNVKIVAIPFRNHIGNVINFETGSAWAIPKGAKHQDAACTWMKTMTSVPTWMAAAVNRAAIRKAKNQPYTGILTGNAIADKLIYKNTYTSINPYFDQAVKTFLDVQKYSFGIPASPASAEFQSAWQDAINRVLAGQQSVKAALNQAQKEAQAAIDRAK